MAKKHYTIFLKSLLLTIAMLFMAASQTEACHESTVTELSAGYNGNGTYTYLLEVCIGFEDTWGFELDFVGANILNANIQCITDPHTSRTICAGTANGSKIEYGDYNNTSNPVFHAYGSSQVCWILSFVLDAPAAQVNMYGSEFNFGPCSPSSALTTCFEPNYNLVLQTDAWGNETTWEVKDAASNIVASGGPYTSNSFHNIPLCLGSGCYEFTIYDTYGDGICCNWGNGYYQIFDSMGNTAAYGANFGLSQKTNLGCNVLLPVEISSWNGKWNETSQAVELNWLTQQEVNIERYEIQRANAEGVFEALGSVSPKEVAINKYMYPDVQPLHGINQYRLKVLEINGAVEYSDIIEVSVEIEPTSSKVYPMPFDDDFHFEIRLEEPTTLAFAIYSLEGKQLSSTTQQGSSGNNVMRIETPDLPKGFYILKVRNGSSVAIHRIVKQ